MLLHSARSRLRQASGRGVAVGLGRRRVQGSCRPESLRASCRLTAILQNEPACSPRPTLEARRSPAASRERCTVPISPRDTRMVRCRL